MKRRRRPRTKPLSPHALMIGLMKLNGLKYHRDHPLTKRQLRTMFRRRAHAIPGMVDKIITDWMDTYTGSM